MIFLYEILEGELIWTRCSPERNFSKLTTPETWECSSEEYTIASDDTDSFRDNNALSLDGIDNIWEQGISNSSSANVDTPTSQSILGDTILGDKGR